MIYDLAFLFKAMMKSYFTVLPKLHYRESIVTVNKIDVELLIEISVEVPKKWLEKCLSVYMLFSLSGPRTRRKATRPIPLTFLQNRTLC